jgi:hypothetical protein
MSIPSMLTSGADNYTLTQQNDEVFGLDGNDALNARFFFGSLVDLRNVTLTCGNGDDAPFGGPDLSVSMVADGNTHTIAASLDPAHTIARMAIHAHSPVPLTRFAQ